MPRRAEAELGTDVLAEPRHALRVAGGVAVLRLEGEDHGLDRLLLRGPRCEVARERAPRDQDRDDEQRHDRRPELEVHPPEPEPQHRKRKSAGVERRYLTKHPSILLTRAECHRHRYKRRVRDQVRKRCDRNRNDQLQWRRPLRWTTQPPIDRRGSNQRQRVGRGVEGDLLEGTLAKVGDIEYSATAPTINGPRKKSYDLKMTSDAIRIITLPLIPI